MSTKTKENPVAKRRQDSGLNQSDFWRRYGVTQSGGSRYESGRAVPTPTAILMQLHTEGTVTDDQLAAALAKIKPR